MIRPTKVSIQHAKFFFSMFALSYCFRVVYWEFFRESFISITAFRFTGCEMSGYTP